MFRVDKWYLDVITDSGRVVVLYAGRVEWDGLRANFASVLRASETGGGRERTTIRRVTPPRPAEGSIAWSNVPLSVEGTWRPDAAPIAATLASGASGAIEWTCHMPRAHAAVCCEDERYEGLGYVERLEVTMPLSALPFETLRWGRHVSLKHSMVWIDWLGRRDRRWVWRDGAEQREAPFAGDVPVALSVAETRRIRDRELLPALAALPSVLARRLGGGIGRMHERKLVGRSTLTIDGTPVDRGWSLYEVVTR